jgi:hypothetical protein
MGNGELESITSEIDSLLIGKKVDSKLVRKLEHHDEKLWKIMLQEIAKKKVEIRFSKDLILILNTNCRVWSFLEEYLKRLVYTIRQHEKIPLLDLSEFCGFLKFRREVLRLGWQADQATIPTVVECTALLIKYAKELNELKDEGALTLGKFEQELILFFKTLDGIISAHLKNEELNEIRKEAKKVGLIR